MSVGQYLEQYAEPEINEISSVPFYYENILVLPVFNEPQALINKLKNIHSSQSLLIILVVNAPDKVDDEDKVLNTQNFAKALKQSCQLLQSYTSTINLLSLNDKPRHHLLLVERCDTGLFIPYKQGVGLARKIACDIACKIIALGQINSQWIHCTDADVTLPAGYFEVKQSLDPNEVAVALYPFQHSLVSNSKINTLQKLYDISLYYYVDGLHWAGSPYAYHTIGSTLVINFNAYALVRGFPKRSAGEDFYLLNKVAKFSDIVRLNSPILSIDTRLSDRVPFGTGPALLKMEKLTNPQDDYLYYHPLCFSYLKEWLLVINKLWESDIWDKEHHSICTDIFIDLFNKSPTINPQLIVASLQDLGVLTVLEHAFQNSKSADNFLRHMHNWFDGFKTLRFIHLLRDALEESGTGKVNLQTLLSEAPFLSEATKQLCDSEKEN